MSTNKKKLGRPAAVNPLEHDCKVRFTDEQLKRVDATAARHGVKRAAFIRAAVMDAVTKDEHER